MAIQSVVPTTPPVATTFMNAKGETLSFYIRNNPWKVFAYNSQQKIFLYCIICGEARFSAEEWSTVARSKIGPTTTCNKEACWKIDPLVTNFIPRNHYMIFTETDKSRTQGERGQDFFEEVEEVTSVKANKSESEIPPEYRETLKRLEAFPRGDERLSEIDAIHFKYMRENNIPLGKTLADTNDPFLKFLAEYRQKQL